MFLQVSVILFTGQGLVLGGCLLPGRRVPAPGGWVPGLGSGGCGCPLPGGCLVETPQMATAAGSAHPTGMHSCIVTSFWVVTPTDARPINRSVTLNSIHKNHNN